MARPLKGNVVPKPGGRFQASVPTARGSGTRRYEMFDTRAQAQAWCALAVAAIEAELAIPHRDVVLGATRRVPDEPGRTAPRANSAPVAAGTATRMTVAQVAADWFEEVYVDGRSGAPERARSVQSILRRHVIAFLEPILDQGRPLTRAEYRAHLAALGRPGGSKAGPGRPATLGMAQDVVNDVRRCLDAVLRHGVQLGAWALPFDTNDVRTPRSRRPKTPKAAGLSLAEVAAIAAHLHPVHQVVLWTCRILTVRLGEAYGIRVKDLMPLDDGTGRGLLWLHAQGGRTFTVFDGDTVVQTAHKEEMKHGYSERMQLVPAQLMALFGDAIDVFHTDHATGRVDVDARLIPGLQDVDRGGQQAFRRALTRAASGAGIEKTAIHGFARTVVGTPTPKDLRSSAVTDLEWVPGLDPTALRRYAGHAPGTDVHALHYVVDQPGNAKAAQLCSALEALISVDVPTGLRVPTTVPCTTRTQPNLRARAGDIDARLYALGWLVGDVDDADDIWLGVQDAALVLGQTPVTVRRWVREGRLQARAGNPGGGTGSGHLIRRSTLAAFADEENGRVTLTDLEAQTGISYHRLYNWIKRFNLACEPCGQRGISLPPATVDALRRYVELERAHQRIGMTYADAARALGVTSRTIAARAALRTLEPLPELGPDGLAYVTRTSVARAISQPGLMRKRPNRRRR